MTVTETAPNKLVGAPVRNTEHPRLLAGHGQYLDDISVPRMLEAAVLRSPFAHARITKIDVSHALDLPGVFDVVTGEDLALSLIHI